MKIKKEDRNLIVKKSRNGKGIFVKKEFVAEEILFEVTGTFMACDEGGDVDEETRANTYRYDENLYISPKGKIGDFLNHSCEPNAKVVKKDKKLSIVAIQPIPSSTEVLIDYSTITADDDSWEMDCNCGSLHCRGLIKKWSSLPKKTRERYKAFHMVPKYILG